MKIYIGADHRGFSLKEKMKTWLDSWKFDFEDLGALNLNPEDNYTLYAEKVASLISNSPHNKGILICGSGVGVDVVANKFDGVRSSLGKNSQQIKAGRTDDDMNILVIAADFTSEEEAKAMLKTFLETNFDHKTRHENRLEEIKRIEENN